MNINWVFAADYSPDATVDIESIKQTGPTWGSWKSWRACSTDNVVCDTRKEAETLLSRDFQASCNFYISEKVYKKLKEPDGVLVYGGDFSEKVADIEDVIAMHLAAVECDLVVLCGFNFDIPTSNNKAKLHRLGLIRSTINQIDQVQWVAIDHDQEHIDKIFKSLPNLTCDSFDNVLYSLSN